MGQLTEAGYYKFYFDSGSGCSTNYLGYVLDLTPPPTIPTITILSSQKDHSHQGSWSLTPELTISNITPGQSIKIYASKNDIPCETLLEFFWAKSTETTLTLESLEEYGDYKFYAKSFNTNGLSSPCSDPTELYEYSSVVRVGVSSEEETLQVGGYINIAVMFNKDITVDTSNGLARIPLIIGEMTRYAYYRSGGGRGLNFRYQIARGDTDKDGIELGGYIDLNGGIIGHSDGTDINLYLGRVVASGISIDTTGPQITGVSIEGKSYLPNQIIKVLVSMDENVYVDTKDGSPSIALTIGSNTREALYTSADQNVVTFIYTVANDDVDDDGISIASSITPNGAVFTDYIGGPLSSFTLNAPDNLSSVLVNVPYIESTHIADNNYAIESNIDITVNFDREIEIDTSSGIPQIPLTVGTTTKYALYYSGVGTMAIFRYIADEQDIDGIELGDRIELNSGSIQSTVNRANADIRLANVDNLDFVLIDKKITSFIPRISLGSSSSCALLSVGEIACWGSGNFGELGNGKRNNSSIPVRVRESSSSVTSYGAVTQVSSGNSHTCALKNDGGVLCWGMGSSGQLGNDTTYSSDSSEPNGEIYPVFVVDGDGSNTPLSGISQISSGYLHTCALKNDGGVLCWGSGSSGQLGNDTSGHGVDHPVVVIDGDGSNTPLSGISQISSGSSHTCALKNDGGVLCWGSGSSGQLGNDTIYSSEPYGVDHPVVVIDGDGSSTPLSGISQISSGSSHTCALKNDGGVLCWGSGDYGQLGDDTTYSPESYGVDHPVVVIDGDGSSTPLSGISQISSGSSHTCALKNDGGVLCWGSGNQGQLGDDTIYSSEPYGVDHPVVVIDGDGSNTPLSGISQMSSGNAHTCALKNDGGVLCWGYGREGQLGDDTTYSSGPYGVDHPVVVIDGDGSNIPLSGISQISSGSFHACALKNDGGVLCWGSGGDGQLGNGNMASVNYPVKLQGLIPLANAVAIEVGDSHACAQKDSGEVLCWGSNNHGQLGNDGTSNSDYPSIVIDGDGSNTPLFGISQISLGVSYTCALKNDGGVLCWGAGSSGQLGNGNINSSGYPIVVIDGSGISLSGISQISSGRSHACALKSDGRVLCWGAGGSGRLGNGTTSSSYHPIFVVDGDGNSTHLSDIVQITGGEYHTCALTNNGGVLCWGSGNSGQLGNGTTSSSYHPVVVIDGDGSSTPTSGISQISAGSFHTCALKDDGKVLCWGTEVSGRLGAYSSPHGVGHPVIVINRGGSNTPLSGIDQIRSGGAHTCALKNDGRVLCWGHGSDGQLGNRGTNSSRHPVIVSDSDFDGMLQVASYQRSMSCRGGGQCLLDPITLVLGDSTSEPTNINFTGPDADKELSLYSDADCMTLEGTATFSDGVIELTGLNDGNHRFYYAVDNNCSTSYFDYAVDTLSPSHSPYMYLGTNSPNTIVTPWITLSGWPDDIITARVYVSKNDIPCEIEVGVISGIWEHGAVVWMTTSALPGSGLYKFYTKAIDFFGNESNCKRIVGSL